MDPIASLYETVLERVPDAEAFENAFPIGKFSSDLSEILNGRRITTKAWGHGKDGKIKSGSDHIGCMGEWYSGKGRYDRDYCLEVFKNQSGDYFLRNLLLRQSRETEIAEIVKPYSDFDSTLLCEIPKETILALKGS
jgi:hypothetical protein